MKLHPFLQPNGSVLPRIVGVCFFIGFASVALLSEGQSNGRFSAGNGRHASNRIAPVVVFPLAIPLGQSDYPFMPPMVAPGGMPYPHGHFNGSVPNYYSSGFGSSGYHFQPPTADNHTSPMMAQGMDIEAPVASYPIIATKAIARNAQRRAEAAFYEGNYHLASSLARQVVTLDPENGIAFLFSAQTNFAIANYDRAAQDIRNAIELLPIDKWDYVAKNFRIFYGRNDFVRQMDRLEQFLSDRPVYVPALIVRGHQWGSLGYFDSARDDLLLAQNYRPKDETIRKLSDKFGDGGLPMPGSDYLSQPAPTVRTNPPRILANETIFPIPNAQIQPTEELLPPPDQTDLDETEALDNFELRPR